MAVSYDYISGCVHVACTCTIGILRRPVLAGAWYYCFIIDLLHHPLQKDTRFPERAGKIVPSTG